MFLASIGPCCQSATIMSMKTPIDAKIMRINSVALPAGLALRLTSHARKSTTTPTHTRIKQALPIFFNVFLMVSFPFVPVTVVRGCRDNRPPVRCETHQFPQSLDCGNRHNTSTLHVYKSWPISYAMTACPILPLHHVQHVLQVWPTSNGRLLMGPGVSPAQPVRAGGSTALLQLTSEEKEVLASTRNARRRLTLVPSSGRLKRKSVS